MGVTINNDSTTTEPPPYKAHQLKSFVNQRKEEHYSRNYLRSISMKVSDWAGIELTTLGSAVGLATMLQGHVIELNGFFFRLIKFHNF